MLMDAKKSDLPTLGSCVWQPITGKRTPGGVTSSPRSPNICLSDSQGRQIDRTAETVQLAGKPMQSKTDSNIGHLRCLLSQVWRAIISHNFKVTVTSPENDARTLDERSYVFFYSRTKQVWGLLVKSCAATVCLVNRRGTYLELGTTGINPCLVLYRF